MRNDSCLRPATPRLRLTGPLALGILAVMLIAGVPGAGTGAPVVARTPGTSAPAGHNASSSTSGTSGIFGENTSGSAEIAAAGASLANGQGPADGQSLECAAAFSVIQASCSPAAALPGYLDNQSWRSTVRPNARAGAVMTYDGLDRYVVLFGGFNGSAYLSDTWEFTHGTWLQMAPPVSPSARANASMAYDAHDKYVVLFGGFDGTHVLGDTWEFAGGQWTQLSPAMSPPARKDATMSYDTLDGYLVLFGGSSGATALGDSWTFVGGTWTEVAPSTSPSPRWGSASTFDTLDNYVLLFGGYSGTSFLGDTWEYAGGQWTQLFPSSSPSPRYESGMAYDTNTSFVVLFGGASRSGSTWTAYGDTWSYASGVWALDTPSPGVDTNGGHSLPAGAPAARQAVAMAYSGTDQDVIVFGGVVDGDPIAATDTWAYEAGNWSQILTEPQISWATPSGRIGAGAANDMKDGYAVDFGGATADGPNAETWIFITSPEPVWTETFPTTSPSPRAFMGMTYDTSDGYVVLFGGLGATGVALGDTWIFTDGNWTLLHPTTSPAARYGAMMAYDVADGYVLLFGGTNGATHFSDTWIFQGGVWSQLEDKSGGPSPSARAFSGLAWDNKTGYVMLFGGTSGSAALGDTWSYLGGFWTDLEPTGTPALPAPEWGMTFVAYGKTNNVFMFGGCTAPSVNPLAPSCPASDTLGTTWQYGVGVWSVVSTSPTLTAIPATPQPRFFAAGVYAPYTLRDPNKPAPEAIIFFGGITSSGTLVTDRWNYQSELWTVVFPAENPSPRYGEVLTFDDRSEKALLFGGIGPVSGGGLGYLDDTWMWDTTVWGISNSTVNPSPRAFAAAAYFGTLTYVAGPTAANYTLMFGGVGPTGYLGDTWRWIGSPPGGQWVQLFPSSSPSPRSNESLTYDAADNEIVLFGGQNSGGYLGDTWVYSASGLWKEIFTSPAPPARAGAAMVYDSEDRYVVLFGGRNAGGALNDTWTFAGGVWTELAPPTAPPARYGASIVDCPYLSTAATGQPELVLLVGGTNGSAFFGDSWAFLGGQWTEIPTPTPTFVPFAFGGMFNDVDDQHPTFFGGLTAGGPLGELWQFFSPTDNGP